MERLDRLLARELNITRSEAKSAIKSGKIRINGRACTAADAKINPDSDCVEAEGKELSVKKFVYIMMNKPPGVISSSDGRKTAEKTVIDILPEDMRRKNLFPAGRLDKDTTGFVLITDDGAFAHKILSPKNHISKTYIARLDRPFDPSLAGDFESGVMLGGVKCLPARLESINENNDEARVVIRQGMYHQIKRMFAKYSITVTELKRVAMGGLELDKSLMPGECRYITPKELDAIISGGEPTASG